MSFLKPLLFITSIVLADNNLGQINSKIHLNVNSLRSSPAINAISNKSSEEIKLLTSFSYVMETYGKIVSENRYSTSKSEFEISQLNFATMLNFQYENTGITFGFGRSENQNTLKINRSNISLWQTTNKFVTSLGYRYSMIAIGASLEYQNGESGESNNSNFHPDFHSSIKYTIGI